MRPELLLPVWPMESETYSIWSALRAGNDSLQVKALHVSAQIYVLLCSY